MLPQKVSHGPQNTPQLSLHFHFIAGFYGAVLFSPTLSQPDPHTTESGPLFCSSGAI